MQIYLKKNDRQSGPFTEDQARGMIAAGTASASDQAWVDGAPDWLPLGQVLGLPSVPGTPSDTTLCADPTATDGPCGVGGWLAFFCVCLTILTPLFTIFQMTGAWNQAAGDFRGFPAIKTALVWENSCLVLLVMYGIIVGGKIWSGIPTGRRIARRYLLVRLFGIMAIKAIALILIRDLPPHFAASHAGAAFSVGVGNVVFFLVWWLYFKLSKRVRNTYGPENPTPVSA